MAFNYTAYSSLIGTSGSNIPQSGIYNFDSIRKGRTVTAGSGFSLYIPVAGDSYTLSNYTDLGSATIGAVNRYIASGFVRSLIHGQGRGVLGSGSSTFSSTSFQLMYDATGTSNFNYTGFNDAFQPGTPHEMGGFLVANTYWIGGFNDTTAAGSYTVNNGTTRSWLKADGTVVVLLGNTTSGHAVFQYRIDSTDPRIVKMSMSYTNTTSGSVTLSGQRGGDCDFDNYTTTNIRQSSELVTATGQSSGKTVGLYCPGNGYSHNCVVSNTFTAANPIGVVNGSQGGGASSSDVSIYCGWDLGTVAIGQTVYVNSFYILADSAAAAITLANSITV